MYESTQVTEQAPPEAFMGPIKGYLDRVNGLEFYAFDFELDDPPAQALGEILLRLAKMEPYRPTTFAERYVLFVENLIDRFRYAIRY